MRTMELYSTEYNGMCDKNTKYIVYFYSVVPWSRWLQCRIECTEPIQRQNALILTLDGSRVRASISVYLLLLCSRFWTFSGAYSK